MPRPVERQAMALRHGAAPSPAGSAGAELDQGQGGVDDVRA